jgi:WD40 repeat protein
VDGVELDRHRVEGVRAAALVDLSGTVAVAGKEKLLAIRSATSDWRIPVGAVTGLAVTGSGQIVTTSADGQLASRQLADGATASSVATPAPVGLSLTGTRVLVWSADQTFRSYDLSSAEPLLKEFPASTSATAAVLWGGDERSAVRVLTDGKLEFWSLEAPAGPTATLATPAPLNAASSLGSRVVAVAGGDKVVRFFEPPPAPVMDFAGHEDQVFSVAFAPDGGFASGGGDYSVRLWSATESQAIASLKGHASLVYSVAFHPGGQVVASAGGDRTVILWNRADGRELRRLAGAEGVLYQTAFVEGGAKVLAGGVDRKLRLWETETGALIKTMEGQPDEIYGLAVNTAGTRWATSGIQGNVLVWDAATGQVVFSHKLPAGAYSVAYRPDGTQIAVGSADHKIYVIDLPEAAR